MLAINSGLNSLCVSLSAPRRYFSRAVELTGEMLRTPRFGLREFEREREGLIENSRCRESAPATAAIRRALAALFDKHPYGRSQGGDAGDLQLLTPETVRKFHRIMLRRGRVVAAFGGDCSAPEATKLRDRLFDGMPWAEDASEPPPEPGFPTAPVRIDLELPREQTAVVLALPGMRLDDYVDRRIDILQQCENGLSSHLFRQVREDNALAYSVGMMLNGGFRRGSFVFYALTDESGAEKALKLLREEVTRLAESGVDDAEFLPAREAAAFEADSVLESQSALTETAALDLYYGLPPERMAERGTLLRKMTRKEFNALLKERFADALEHAVSVVARGTGTGD